MGKHRVTPWTVSVALIQASQDASTAAKSAAGWRPDSRHSDEWGLATSLATAIVRLDQLRRTDARADFGDLHQQLLEFLPPLVSGEPITPARLTAVSSQLGVLASHVLKLDGSPPARPADTAAAVATAGAELLAETRAQLDRDFPVPGGWASQPEHMRQHFKTRVAGSPLPLTCPKGCPPAGLSRMINSIGGRVLDCVACETCADTYALTADGWILLVEL